MFGSIGRAFSWFVGGLVDAWLALANSARRGRRVTLVRSGSGYAVEQRNGRRANTLLRVEEGRHGRALVPADLASTLRNRDVDLVMAADEVLVRALDPLPGESRQYLDSIVQHQLERIAPWRSDDVLHTYRIAPAEHGVDRVLVTVIATARSLHAHALDALQALHPREIRLLCREGQFGPAAAAIPVDRGAAMAAREVRVRRGIAAAIALLTLTTLGGAGLLGWAWYRADVELATIAQEVAQQRKHVLASRPKTAATDRDLKAMIERRWKTPFAVLALDAIANALPDNTWLTELRLANGRIRMTGISQNVPGLVPVIEASPAFAGATFFAPTTRLPDGQGDRFHLEARLLPIDGPKP